MTFSAPVSTAESPETPVDAQDKLLASRIRKLLRDGTYVVRTLDSNLRLTPARLSLMSHVVNGPQRVSALAKVLAIRVPSVTEQVISLEREGLVERHPDPTDSRAVLVAATTLGRRVYAEETEIRTAVFARHLASLTQAEKDALNQCVPIFNRIISDIQGQ